MTKVSINSPDARMLTRRDTPEYRLFRPTCYVSVGKLSAAKFDPLQLLVSYLLACAMQQQTLFSRGWAQVALVPLDVETRFSWYFHS
jgi:hypothetical protein